MIHRHLSVYSACDDTTCLETPIHTSGVDGQRRLSYVLPSSMPQDWMRVSRDGSILWPLTSGMPNRHRLRLRHHGGNRQHPHAPRRRHRPQCHLAASLQVTCRRGMLPVHRPTTQYTAPTKLPVGPRRGIQTSCVPLIRFRSAIAAALAKCSGFGSRLRRGAKAGAASTTAGTMRH